MADPTVFPLALNAALSARLRGAITAPNIGSMPGMHHDAFQAMLADPTVEALVLMVPLHGDAPASLVRLVRESDRLAQWATLASI